MLSIPPFLSLLLILFIVRTLLKEGIGDADHENIQATSDPVECTKSYPNCWDGSCPAGQSCTVIHDAEECGCCKLPKLIIVS